MKWIDTQMISDMMASSAERRHCWIPPTDEGAFFEVTPEPCDPATAAEWAPWAPATGTDETQQYIQQLKERSRHG